MKNSNKEKRKTYVYFLTFVSLLECDVTMHTSTTRVYFRRDGRDH